MLQKARQLWPYAQYFPWARELQLKTQKSAKLFWVRGVKDQADLVRTEKFKLVLSAQGPVKPQQCMCDWKWCYSAIACSGHCRRATAGQGALIYMPSQLLHGSSAPYTKHRVRTTLHTDVYVTASTLDVKSVQLVSAVVSKH